MKKHENTVDTIRRLTKASVIVANKKPFFMGWETHGDGTPVVSSDGKLVPKLSRQLTDEDAVELTVKRLKRK